MHGALSFQSGAFGQSLRYITPLELAFRWCQFRIRRWQRALPQLRRREPHSRSCDSRRWRNRRPALTLGTWAAAKNRLPILDKQRIIGGAWGAIWYRPGRARTQKQDASAGRRSAHRGHPQRPALAAEGVPQPRHQNDTAAKTRGVHGRDHPRLTAGSFRPTGSTGSPFQWRSRQLQSLCCRPWPRRGGSLARGFRTSTRRRSQGRRTSIRR